MEIRDLRIRETVTLTDRRDLAAVMEATFFVDTHGPFSVMIPKAEYTKARLLQEVDRIKATIPTAADLKGK